MSQSKNKRFVEVRSNFLSRSLQLFFLNNLLIDNGLKAMSLPFQAQLGANQLATLLGEKFLGARWHETLLPTQGGRVSNPSPHPGARGTNPLPKGRRGGFEPLCAPRCERHETPPKGGGSNPSAHPGARGTKPSPGGGFVPPRTSHIYIYICMLAPSPVPPIS